MKPLEKVTALDSGQVRLNAFRRSGAFGNGIDFMLQDEYLLNDALHGWRRQQPQIFSAGTCSAATPAELFSAHSSERFGHGSL